MDGTIIVNDLGFRVEELDRYTNGKPAYLNGTRPSTNTRMSHGYPQIGDAVFVSYDSRDGNLKLPAGETRGIIFDIDDDAKRFKVTFVNLGALHPTYDSLGKDSVKAKIKAMSTYAIPDGLEHLVIPRPSIYNAHGVKIL